MSAEANDKKRFIRIRGANENNLKNLSVDIPRDQFVVLTADQHCGTCISDTGAFFKTDAGLSPCTDI